MPQRCAEPSCNQRLPQGRYRRFCPGRACKRVFDQRAACRAYRLYAVAMKWRSFPRSHQRGAKNRHNPYFGEISTMLDDFLREDREMREQANAKREALSTEAPRAA
jgi:hypothetical protein